MLYIILKKAWRVEGAIVPLFNSLPVFNARVLRIGAFKEWALLIIALVCLEVDFIIVALSGILSNQEGITERVEVVVSSLYADPPFSFDLKPFTKSLTLGKELIVIS